MAKCWTNSTTTKKCDCWKLLIWATRLKISILRVQLNTLLPIIHQLYSLHIDWDVLYIMNSCIYTIHILDKFYNLNYGTLGASSTQLHLKDTHWGPVLLILNLYNPSCSSKTLIYTKSYVYMHYVLHLYTPRWLNGNFFHSWSWMFITETAQNWLLYLFPSIFLSINCLRHMPSKNLKRFV